MRCHSACLIDQRVRQPQTVVGQAISVNIEITYNTTSRPMPDYAITVTNALSSINRLTTLRWTQPSLTTSYRYIGSSPNLATVTEAASPPTSASAFVLIITEHKRNRKRQSVTYYVGTNGAITNNCTTGPTYSVNNGVLTAADGSMVYTYSSFPGVPHAVSQPSTIPGPITTAFALGGNVLLSWTNDALYNGAASFCTLQNGAIYAVFVQT